MPTITEKTLIPLSLVGVLAGGIAWCTKINIAVTSAQAAIIDQKKSDAEYHEKVCALLRSIDQRLSRIEGSRRKLGE
ncbi:MAG: hypothetical protein HC841_00225 [Verrucomicrobiae bacterium]|nr:hypothetical protein [Verrucomicrobiae bacterium]